MNRREFNKLAASVGVGVALTGLASATDSSANTKKPNILFIMTDQQHARMMSCAGNKYLNTPAMDSLAQDGMRFEKAYCSNPVCVPSRTSMATGVMSCRLGAHDNGTGMRIEQLPEEVDRNSLGRIMKRAGYDTFYGGKVHMCESLAPKHAGYDEYFRDQRNRLPIACIDFMQKKRDKPFFALASFINPHDICFAHRARNGIDTQGVLELHKRASALPLEELPPLPDNYAIQHNEPAAIEAHLSPKAVTPAITMRKAYDERAWRINRWIYHRLTEKVDSRIGAILDGLNKAGLAENTVVVFTSDHGNMDASHRLASKGLFYEESVGVPLILTYKGHISAGRTDRTHLVSTGLDILPTLCDYAGVKIPVHLLGKSLRPLAEGRRVDHWRSYVASENRYTRMIRSQRYKYCAFDEANSKESLVDMENDPGEMQNLVDDPQFQQVLAEHRRLLADWSRISNDKDGSKYVKRGIISNKWQSLRTIDEDGLLGQRVDLWRNQRLWFIAKSGYLIDGFEKRPGTHAWQGEHLGKWLHAATLAHQVTGDERLRETLDDMVNRLIATQLPDGYLGTYPEAARFMNVPENEDPKLVTDDIETKKTRQRRYRGGWDTWTFRYNLYGLLTYEKVFPNDWVVDACKQMADLLIKTYGRDRSDLTKYGTRRGISATTLLESIVMLYERTLDKKYLDFAEEIVRMSEDNPALRLMGTMLNNGSVVHPGDGKGYQLMANLLGYLRLYRCTGNENYLKTVTYAWNDIHENHILVTGGPWSRKMPYNGNGECFARTDAFHPEKIKVEGCCDATWIQLNIHLFELTGQAKYMDEAEISLLNSVYAHQHREGKEWCYFTKPNEARMPYEDRFHCCGSSEPRGMEMYSDHLAGTINKNLSINTLFPATIQAANRFGGGHIRIGGSFPLEPSAKIYMETLKKKKFTLEFRVPANTSLEQVRVNGQTTATTKNARGFVELTRTWHRGDVIAVDMDFALKASVQVGEGNKKWVAFNYGPHALAQKITAIPSEEPFLGMNEKEISKMLRMLSKSSDSDIAFSIKETDIHLLPYYMTCTKETGSRTYFRL